MTTQPRPDTSLETILDNVEAHITWVDNDEGRLAIWLQPNKEAFKKLRGHEHEGVLVTITRKSAAAPDTAQARDLGGE